MAVRQKYARACSRPRVIGNRMGAWEKYVEQGLSLVLSMLLLSAAAQPVDILKTPEEAPHGSGAVKAALGKAGGLRQHIKLFIGIPSLYEHGDLRDAARETWIPIAKASHAVAVRFFCFVDTTDEGLMARIKNEQAVYRDTIIVTLETLGGRSALKEQSWQTRMTMNILHTATEKFESDFIMQAAEKAYNNIPVIMRLLWQQRGQENIFPGHATPGFILDPKKDSEVSEHKEVWEDNVEQPIIAKYMDGAGAMMPADVGEALRAAERLLGMRMLRFRDAAIGLWLSTFQMRYMNETEAGCSVRPFQPALEGGGDAGWTAGEGSMLCLSHDMPLAVVHPLTADLMREVFASATACHDTLSNRSRK